MSFQMMPIFPHPKGWCWPQMPPKTIPKTSKKSKPKTAIQDTPPLKKNLLHQKQRWKNLWNPVDRMDLLLRIYPSPLQANRPGDSKWPFYPRSLEVTNSLPKDHLYNHPKKGTSRIARGVLCWSSASAALRGHLPLVFNSHASPWRSPGIPKACHAATQSSKFGVVSKRLGLRRFFPGGTKKTAAQKHPPGKKNQTQELQKKWDLWGSIVLVGIGFLIDIFVGILIEQFFNQTIHREI